MSDLASEYQAIHASQPDYGSASHKLLRYIRPLIDKVECTRIIDYGCGKGSLGKAIQSSTGIETWCYDPYVPEFSSRPEGSFDLLVNTDVLEHIPEEALPTVLQEMKLLADRCFLVISTRYADQLLSNGQNAHCTVKPEEWWHDLLRGYFPHVQRIEVDTPDTCAFVTWPLKDDTLRELRKAGRRGYWRRKLKRRLVQLIAWLKIKANWFATEGDLHIDLKGKSVAIVGNARSLAAQSHGSEIDAHDLVIRFNRAPIASLASHGRRTDWIATGMTIDGDLAERRGARRVLWCSRKRKLLSKDMLRDRQMFILSFEDHALLTTALGSEPSTGLIVIDILSRSECQKVDIYGFDFFSSQSLSCHTPINKTFHNFDLEKQFVRTLCERDARFQIVGQPIRS